MVACLTNYFFVIFSVGPDEHPTAVDRIQTSLKSLNKVIKTTVKEAFEFTNN